MDAQADLSLRQTHRPYCWFCHTEAHVDFAEEEKERIGGGFYVHIELYVKKSNFVLAFFFFFCSR